MDLAGLDGVSAKVPLKLGLQDTVGDTTSPRRRVILPGHDAECPRSMTDEDGVLKKDLGWLGILAAGYNISNSWLVIVATMTISIGYGPMTTIWGILAVTPIYLCIGLSLAELISAYPTTGGQYHWTSILAPESVRASASYFCGFLSWISWLTMAASSTNAIWLCVYALILNYNPDFVKQSWQPFLTFQAVNVTVLLFNMFGKKIVSGVYTIGFVLSVSAFFVFTIVSLVMQKHKQNSEVIWTSYSQESGWSPGVQFIIAMTAPVIAFCPLDGAVHLVEEVKDASRVVPQTVLAALMVSFVTSLAFALAALYCVSDFTAVLQTVSGFPLFTIWQQATSTDTVPTVFTFVTLFLLPFGSIACVQVASMMTWSLGKDGGLAFRRHLSKINRKFNAPLWALLLNFCILFLIGCVNLFSPLAFNAIVSVAAILQQVTMAFPVFFLLYYGRSHTALPPDRSFRLPNWLGWTANTVTLAFTGITSTFFFLPSVTTVSAETMNYACVVVGGTVIVSVLNWFLFARSRYNGPTAMQFHH